MASYEIQIAMIVKESNFRSSVHMSESDYAAKTPADLQNLANAHYATYLQTVEDAKNMPPVVPTKEELEKYSAELQLRLDEVQAKIDAQVK
jgi:hypothetical protein